MKLYRYLLPIVVSLLLLCMMVGAVSADANYVNATYVSAYGSAYAGNYSTITGVDVQTNGVMAVSSATASTYFAVYDDVANAWNTITVTQDYKKISSHLPKQVGSSAILATSPAKGAAVASIPDLVLHTGDGDEFGALGSDIEHTYSALGTYLLTAENLAFTGYFGAVNIPISVYPASVTVQTPRTTVNFYYNNGTDQYVEKVFIVGETPVAPAVPSYPNYNFQGWNLSLGDGSWTQLFNSANEPLEVSGYINETKKWTNTSAGPLNVYAEWKKSEGMQLNLTAGDGFVIEDGKYYISQGTTANVTVSVKYNLTKMGWSSSKADPKVNTINITAVADFNVPGNMSNVTFTPANGAGTFGEMSGSSYKIFFTLTTPVALSDDGEFTVGKLSLTAPANWDGWNIETPFNITFANALASNKDGALIEWAGSTLTTEEWQSVDAPENAFTLYPLDEVPPELYSVKYFDGRYVYEQQFLPAVAGPKFYLYNDIYNGAYTDATYGNFTLNTTKDSVLVRGYYWNTDNFGDDFKFKAAETLVKTNFFDRTHFNVSPSKAMNVSLNFSGAEEGKKSITVQIENYRQSHNNNSMSGWFFNTPYKVTINVRPGPAAINVSAGTVAWDSGIAYDEFTNKFASTTGYVWSGATSGNTGVEIKNDFVGGKNIIVNKSASDLSGPNAVITLTGERLGDVNKNGVVNLNDASKLGFIIAKDVSSSGDGSYADIIDEKAYAGLDKSHVMLLDCNAQGGDGVIDTADLREMYKWLSSIYSGYKYSYDDWKTLAV